MKIAIISDIHGNLEALAAVLADIESRGIAQIICIGDLVGYGPNPEEVVGVVRRRGIETTLGNHEMGISHRAERRWFNPKARQTLSQTEKLLSTESLAFIARLPVAFTRHGSLFVHGFPPDSVKTYLFEEDTDALADYFKSAETEMTFVGHTHDLEVVTWDGHEALRYPLEPGESTLDYPKTIVNVGSVGQPRDGDNRAKYVIWEPQRKRIVLRRIPYDIQKTADKILERGFPEYYAQRLY